ncbi:chromosome segregation ATPase [Moritella sp. 24]|uniref:chromosome segregation ATPase n=1 Tax=Moritella sp. 24 TaxID=2746230 RepID=UPI001BAD45DD|nr:chromosome segregation ATPase [Moritella sp. 24]QUM76807.1 chromosome segregation ATPase [Moritella sp. 24]
MRMPLLLISVAFIGSVFFFITNENELNSVKQIIVSPALPDSDHSRVQPNIIAETDDQTNGKPQSHGSTEQKNRLQEAKGQALMSAITSFWQLCRQQNNCDELLVQQQLILDENRYQLLLNFFDNQQTEQRLMGSSLISQSSSLADKIAHVKSIREQVWGADAHLLFEDQDAYYDYRLLLADPDSRFNQALSADGFMNEYNAMLEELGEELDRFSLDSDNAKYEEAVNLIPASMPENEAVRIKSQLANKYLTGNEQQAIVNRTEQVDQQQQEVADYQQGLNALEVELANERATSKKTMSDEDWLVYKAERLYQYRLDFFSA